MGNSLTYLTLGDFSDTLVYRLAYRWRQFIIAFSILIVFIFAVAILGPQARAEPYSDQAYYLVVAKSISQGTGLSLISHPEEPLATVAPPGYPILLSGLVKIFGLESTFPYRLLNTFFWLGLIVLMGVLVGQEDGRVWGLFIALLIALNVHIIGFANAILTELPYTFFSIVAIILTYKYIKSVGPRRWIWLIPIIITLSFLPYLRMIAVSLVAAVVLYLIVHRQIRAGLIITVAVGLSYLPWIIIWSQSFYSIDHLFVTNDPFNLDAEARPIVEVMIERIVTNTLYYVSVMRQNILGWSSFDNLSKPLVYNLIGLSVVVPVLVGDWIKLKSRETILVPLYITFYLIILIVPISKGIERYLIPITPFLVWYFLIGVATIIGALASRFSGNLPRLRLVYFAICAGLVYSLLLSNMVLALDKVPIILGKTPPEGDRVHNYLEAADWLQTNTPEDAIILARKMDSLYLRSGRQALRYPHTTNQEALNSFLINNSISYVVLDNLTLSKRWDYLVPYLKYNKTAFEEVYRASDGVTKVFRFNPELANK